jgi:hypothetical protein
MVVAHPWRLEAALSIAADRRDFNRVSQLSMVRIWKRLIRNAPEAFAFLNPLVKA